MREEPAPSMEISFRAGHAKETTVSGALVTHLAELGIEQAFGVIGGAIGVVFDALADSSIAVRHFRHESGAAFAASEAYFASGRPTVVFTTTGPGLLNALTGLTAARWDGAKVILVSGSTSAAQRGRWSTQETSAYTMPQDGLFGAGPIFDFAVRMEHAAEMPEVARRLAIGLARPGGFVAHVSLPIALQGRSLDVPHRRPRLHSAMPSVSEEEAERLAQRLHRDPFAIWVGFGARHAAPEIRSLAARTGAHVFCSPRAKGVFPESDPQFVGVTGLGGHERVAEFMQQIRPRWTLVLGTRLGEATSFWDRDLLPTEGLLHVDVDPDVPGVAFPDVNTEGIQADVGQFLRSLLRWLPEEPRATNLLRVPHRPWPSAPRGAARGPVRPQVLMAAIQRRIVDGSDALVLSESGNAFAWCNHYLRFENPGRYRVSTLFGSMGHCAAGVVGAAMGARRKAVAVVGDGSMLMNSEVSTAVQYGAPALWIVLNDAAYGMCETGQNVLGLSAAQLAIPRVDFAGVARAMGADGLRISREEDLDAALEQALDAPGPFVLDVEIDPNEASPLMERFESLLRQGSSKSVAGWDA